MWSFFLLVLRLKIASALLAYNAEQTPQILVCLDSSVFLKVSVWYTCVCVSDRMYRFLCA